MVIPSLYILLFLVLRGHGTLGQVLQNKTVDDGDPMIRYTGNWIKSAFNSLNAGGQHMLTQDPKALATFEFTGAAIYFLSPLWPYDVTTQVQLNSRPPELLDLMDHHSPPTGGGWETVQSHIVWAAEGLGDGRHTLTITVGAGEEWAVVDGFIVTWVNGSTAITQIQSSSAGAPATTIASTIGVTKTTIVSVTKTSGSPSPSLSPQSGGANILAIGLFSGIGALVLTILALLCYLCRRYRRRSRAFLEEDMPFIPPPPGLSIPPWTPTLSSASPKSPTTVRSPDNEHFGMVPLIPRESWHTSVSSQSMGVTACQAILDNPPPGYSESVNTYRQPHRSTSRKSDFILRNPD